jgi:glucose-6-phosphate 1-epimerase
MNEFQLTDEFGIPDILTFSSTEDGLIRVSMYTPACTAELYLQGAHLTRWQPVGQKPVLFLSERSLFVPGKAIRGGIPIVCPWFGSRTPSPDDPRTDGPSHGFARTSEWTLVFAALSGDDLHLTLTLDPSENSRALGFDHFRLMYEVRIGQELTARLTVANLGDSPLQIEEALHTYFAVGDAKQISIIGLSDTVYLDKTDDFRRKTQKESPLTLTGETDRPYLNTLNPVSLDDPVFRRRITIDKSNSKTTVIWNPWSELAGKMPDMAPNGWMEMTCVETANVADNAIRVGPHGTYTMQAHIFVESLRTS